ncbi:DUF2922 domain-containing protein [Lederbergia wuyishanensis]|uniref:DUF2922 domain-containing protein n=1 Tax=Lederbergia wuyishanensis TaxID=1347903 RepID=A0ABU0DAI3_9BACI|nr:DUF2922 domain-containing protein [Lederbergia wuyishanensis]MCJ8010102.1 DUF2922 domain-containing protein [Lederbergia wuyishanensis]MDQ0345341.1 hypothetical protein [Lederbergia wuyishanensis]
MKVLELNFLSAEGKTSKLTVDKPLEPVNPAQVKEAMENIIASNVFLDTDGNPFVEAKSARLVERNVEEIDIDFE